MKITNVDKITKLFNEFESVEYKGEVLLKENYPYSGFDASKRHMYIIKIKNVEDLVILYSRSIYSNPFCKDGSVTTFSKINESTTIKFIGFGSIGKRLEPSYLEGENYLEIQPVTIKYVIDEEAWKESKNTELYMEGMIKIVNKNDLLEFLLDTEFTGVYNV